MRRFTLIALLVVAGCAGSSPWRGTPPESPCVLRGRGAEPQAATIRVLVPLGEADDWREIQRLSTRPRCSTVIVGCDGWVRSGIASVLEKNGRHVVLAVPNNTVDDWVSSWRAAIVRGAGVDSVRALDARRIEVFLERSDIQTLASPELKVPESIHCANRVPGLRVSTGTDPRDAIDAASDGPAGVGGPTGDLIITHDSAVAAYAGQHGLLVAALPYDETYVLVLPSRAGPAVRKAIMPTRVLRSDLASAVRAGCVRPGSDSVWWRDELDGCGPLSALPAWMTMTRPTASIPPVVFYRRDDDVARDVAERIVALSGMDPREIRAAGEIVSCAPGIVGAVARGVDMSEMDARLARGDGFAFIMSIRNPVPDACGAARALLRRAPWITAAGGSLAGVLVPLLDAQRFVIVASNLAISWDFYGSVTITSPASVNP